MFFSEILKISIKCEFFMYKIVELGVEKKGGEGFVICWNWFREW